MADLEFEIVEHCAVLSKKEESGWQKELNKVSWSKKPAKYDIRDWNADHTRMGKGITLTTEELNALLEYKVTE